MAGGFLPHHAIVTADTAPVRCLVVLHGILGSGANWRTFARRVATACPGWAVVLVDLRAHGLSQGAPPPHAIATAAADLVRLEAHLAAPAEGRPRGLAVRAVLGHSFGGKVALAWAAQRAEAPGSTALDEIVVVDSAPGPRRAPEADDPGGAAAILALLASIPEPLPSRERFVELVLAAGHAKAVAEWLAMNVRRADDGFRLRLDLDAVRALVADYFAADLWPALESERAARRVDVVLGGRSRAVPAVERARLEALARESTRVRVHVLPTAGHWVHVDDPEGLFTIVRSALLARAD
jgi:pimeloyl-ACP methyl ester carboxylesterase